MRTANRWQRDSAVLLLIFLMVLVSGTSGCIRMVQNSLEPADRDSSGSGESTGLSGSGSVVAGPGAGDGSGGTPMPRGEPENIPVVSEASPILPEEKYPVLHGQRFGAVNDTAREPRVFAFERTYVLRSNASGLRVNVDRPPLILTFVASPRNDCIANPSSCRSSLTSPVHRPHFAITVRDNTTGEIVLEDGYGYEFSSGTDNRTLKIYRSGTYHITVYGEFLDVWLGIATGASPFESDALPNPGSANLPGPAPGNSDEYWY